MKNSLFLIFFLVSIICPAQKTWHGDIALYGGGGTNDIFRFNELIGAASFSGKGYWTTGLDFRRIITDHFSIESGLGYSHHYYIRRSAPLPDVTETPGNFGMIMIPVTARLDFLKYFFIDGGFVAGLQAGSSMADNMTGIGLTAGVGFQYMFESDIFLSVRAIANQHALLHFMPEDYPQTLWDSGIRVSVGYQFIRLGKCNCPESNEPAKRFVRIR